MDGNVGIESEVGVGSQFFITIYTRVLDKYIVNNDLKSLTSKEKYCYVQSIGGFNYSKDFYNKFSEIDSQLENGSAATGRRTSFGSNFSQRNHLISRASSSGQQGEIHL